MAAAYASCTTYRDSGVVTTTFFSPARRVERRPFSTRFVRNGGFVFEYRRRRGEEDWDQHAVWIENGRTRTWWSAMPERDGAESLGMALAGATGVSGGSAYRAPHLLMPELDDNSGARPPRPATLLAIPEAAVENCLVIERPRGLGTSEQMWIDRSTFLIRRVVEPRHSLGPPPPEAIERLRATHPEQAAELAKRFAERAGRDPVEVEKITTYEAEFNPAIDPSELTFVPPAT
jgi:hypothetical protein